MKKPNAARLLALLATPLITLLTAGPSPAKEAGEASADREAIESNIAAYTKAYLAKDGAALAAFWSETGEFISPINGEAMSGREKIKNEYTKMFADSGDIALEVSVGSIRFITADVAVEDGIARVIYPGDLPSDSSYRVIHTKQGGKWLIDSIGETLIPAEPADGENPSGGGKRMVSAEMKALGWMIGDWIDDDGEGTAVYYKCSWGMGMSFIRREFRLAIDDRIEMEGIEVIGWDPAQKTYRSWVFDSEGGFGSAIWARDGDSWTKNLTGTTKNGQKAFASHTMIKVDENTYQWRSHGREMDGNLLPNIDTVTVIRQGAEK